MRIRLTSRFVGNQGNYLSFVVSPRMTGKPEKDRFQHPAGAVWNTKIKHEIDTCQVMIARILQRFPSYGNSSPLHAMTLQGAVHWSDLDERRTNRKFASKEEDLVLDRPERTERGLVFDRSYRTL